LGALQLCVPWVLKLLFDALTHGGAPSLFHIVFLLVIVAVGASLFDVLKNYAFTQLAERVLMHIRCQLHAQLRRLPLAHFQREQTGKVMSVLTNDAPAMAKLYNPLLADALINVFQLVAAVITLAVLYGRLALFAPLCGLYLVVPLLFASRLRYLNQSVQMLNAELSAGLQESISATREVKAFNREDWDLRRLRRIFQAFVPLQCRISTLQFTSTVNAFFYWLTAAILYWLVGRRVLANEMSLGSLYALVWYFTFLSLPIRLLVNLNVPLQAALTAADRVFEVLDSQPSVPSSASVSELRPVTGSVRFEAVSFTYQASKPVLMGVSFAVRAGQRVAIVGPSGAGKSTLVSLILRLHEVSSGRILIDGEDISAVSLESLRKQVGAVFQDTFLFNASVRENIRFGKLEASDDEVITAAKASNAHEFILGLPRCYDTEVGERGAALSGGQKQRIAIARAMLLDPPILVLDEATSALDSEAEQAVHEALQRLMSGRTTFVIAHRLSTVADSDDIIVLSKGRVIEIGNHAQLIRRCELYRKCWHLQVSTHAVIHQGEKLAF